MLSCLIFGWNPSFIYQAVGGCRCSRTARELLANWLQLLSNGLLLHGELVVSERGVSDDWMPGDHRLVFDCLQSYFYKTVVISAQPACDHWPVDEWTMITRRAVTNTQNMNKLAIFMQIWSTVVAENCSRNWSPRGCRRSRARCDCGITCSEIVGLRG